MAYPQDGANYKYLPSWVDRMKEDEGKKTTPYKQPDLDRIEKMAGDIIKWPLKPEDIEENTQVSKDNSDMFGPGRTYPLKDNVVPLTKPRAGG